MKADAQTEVEVMAALHEIFAAYAARDIDRLQAAFSPDSDMVNFGAGGDNERRVGLAGLWRECEGEWSATEEASCELGWHSVSAAGSVAWLVADANLRLKRVGEEPESGAARLSMVFERRNGRWLCMHKHFSVPQD
jgi:ketosteroid isomerase-like protein